MFLSNLKIDNEEILEPFLRRLRFGACRSAFRPGLKILDYGCGPKYPFFKFLEENGFPPKIYLGYDPLLAKPATRKNLKTVNKFSSVKGYFDLVSLFAVLEHVDYPGYNFSFLTNHLKKNGLLVLTTPSPAGKWVLEFLCYRLGLVSKREIDEHKHYYSAQEIEAIFTSLGFRKVFIRYYFLNWITAAVFQKT